MKCTNMESLEDLLLNANDIPIMIKKELVVEYWVRLHHVYQSKWETKVKSELKACQKTRPSVLVEDKVCNSAETQGCDCWTCTKVSIKNNMFLP